LTSGRSVIKKNVLLDLLPFSLLFIIFIILKIFEASVEVWRTAGIVMTFLIVAQFLVYLVFSLKLLRAHKENIRHSYSYLENINLNWLRFLITGQMIVWPLLLLAEILQIEPHQLIWVPLALFIYLMGYFSITQPEIISGEIIYEKKTDKASGKKYAKSSLTPEMADNYYCRLTKLLETEKPYLKNDLTLQSLASSLSLSTHFLSQVINQKFNQNFYDLINNSRIEEAKKIMSDPEKNHLSIAAVGFEAGFNSVSSFNSFFKKMMKMTPSEFRKSHAAK
jgi:AraC-like DNA-binding protein